MDTEGEYLQILALPDVFKMRYGQIPSCLYIRHCYRRLYEITPHIMLHYHKDLSATLFTGVPGIGKSMFLIYFLYRFLTDERFPDKRVALELFKGHYHYFEPCPSGGYYCSNESKESCPVLEIPIFSDIKGLVEPMCRGKWLFIFSSPNPLRYKYTMKNSPRFEYTLPTWHYLELKFIDPDDRRWIDRFIRYGGVPRSIFWDGVEKNPEDLLRDALDTKGGMIADYFFKYGFGNIDAETSYMILHKNPPWSPEHNDWLYEQRSVYSFASDEIFKSFAEKHRVRLLAEPINLSNDGVASEVYNLFEKICLWLKPIANQTISVELISNPSNSFRLTLPAMAILDYHWKENARNDLSKKLLPNNLYQPKISNLESGDAFCVIPWGEQDLQPLFCVVILQMTVGENHPVKVNGLHDIILAYPDEIQNWIVEKLLVFITPVDGKLSTVQPYHTQEGKVAERIPNLARGFRQCVCRLAV